MTLTSGSHAISSGISDDGVFRCHSFHDDGAAEFSINLDRTVTGFFTVPITNE